MGVYQFKYTNVNRAIILVSACIVSSLLCDFWVIYTKANPLLLFATVLGIPVLLFLIFKNKVVSECNAKLNETAIIFEFENQTRVINFNELISYKFYSGKNGAILYLKNKVDNFKISTNSYYCKTENFELFCKDAIFTLDKYKEINNPNIIHQGSIYATKWMLYYLIASTIIYLVAFIFESNVLRIAIGIGGAFYLLIMWTLFFTNSKIKSK